MTGLDGDGNPDDGHRFNVLRHHELLGAGRACNGDRPGLGRRNSPGRRSSLVCAENRPSREHNREGEPKQAEAVTHPYFPIITSEALITA